MPISPKSEEESTFGGILDTTPYTENYKELCFRAWYDADKPKGKKILAVLPEDENGRLPNIGSIRKWLRGEDGWNMRARELDVKTRANLDALIIKKRVEMFDRHAEAGAQLVDMGLEYLESFDITSDSVALRAIKEGTDLERKSLGISELLKSISTMSDSQLQKRAEELASADIELSDGEIIEGVARNVAHDLEEFEIEEE
jgi:hypothetical protein